MSEGNSKNKKTKKQKRYWIHFRHKHPIIYMSALGVTIATLLAGLILVMWAIGVVKDTPTIAEHMLDSTETSNMYDRNGNIIWSETEQRRDYIEYDDIPEVYEDMLLSVEDREFYEHDGFSYKGLINAGITLVNEKLFNGPPARGGSTIEQQLIKNSVFSTSETDRTIERKIKEIVLSSQFDENYSKEQVLEWYVNKIDMGENALGAETAMLTYYGISMTDDQFKKYDAKTLSKAATIAGISQAPSMYNIYKNPEGAEERRNTVLWAAVDNGVISKAQYDEAIQVDVTEDLKERYWRNTEVLDRTRQHSSFVTATLEQLADLGYDIEQTPLQIHTTLDPEANNWLNEEINKAEYYQDDEQQVAVTIIDNETREVKAQAGGRNITEPFEYNRATNQGRSTGSIIKPFIDYGPAIEYLGMASDYELNGDNYQYPGTNFVARNYGQHEYGQVDMKFALQQSLNTPAIRLLDEHVGSNLAKQFLNNLGMDNKESYGAGDALGLDLSTADIANGFSTLANKGVHQDIKYITHLEFADGSKHDIQYDQSQAMRESTAFILLKILEGVTSENEFAESAHVEEFDGFSTKTGSVAYSDEFMINNNLPDLSHSDGWVGGTTQSISLALWTGYDNPSEPGHYLVEEQNDQRQTLYANLMRHYNKDRDTSEWERPDTVEQFGPSRDRHWRPLDTNTTQFNQPTVGSASHNELLKQVLELGDDYEVIPETEDPYPIPDGYTAKEWQEELDEEQLELYDRWSDGETDVFDESDLPDDVYTDE